MGCTWRGFFEKINISDKLFNLIVDSDKRIFILFFLYFIFLIYGDMIRNQNK